KYAKEAKKPGMKISSQAMKRLLAYQWPGNVRELQNAIERAVVLKTGDVIEPADLALEPMDLVMKDDAARDLPFHEAVEYYKKQIIRQAVNRANGSQTQAAEILGLQRTYLARLMKQLSIK